MNQYKCLIVDDNLIEREAMRMYLSRIPQVAIAGVYTNGLEAHMALNTVETDIIFSDIDMPELSGIGLLKSLKSTPVFIFMTSHPEYAVESYNLDALDFMVKPVSFERLLKSVNKAVEYLELKRGAANPQVPVIVNNDDYFFIKESNELVKLLYDDVVYIESMADFSKIYTTADKRHITLVSLKNLEAQLPGKNFTRIHKQYIVNNDHISSVGNDEIVLGGKIRLPLGQLHREGLLEKVVNKKVVTRRTKD